MTPDVAGHLPTAGGVPDVHGVVQVKVLGQLGQVIGVVVHVVALAGLRGAAMSTPVVGDHPVAMVQEERESRPSATFPALPPAARQRDRRTARPSHPATPLLESSRTPSGRTR